ncbi:MAG: hypothetical protein LQ351_007702 [Letrouitia transgressa]|nr:MAG: hypothetical protein LQ351_007702 [Letrouitia transgressa]
MPVTVYPSPGLTARSWSRNVGHASSSVALFECSCKREYGNSNRLIQSSYQNLDAEHLYPSENAFIWVAIEAYCRHHHLSVRPEDVWFAILTQLSFYINAHAEELRSYFVAHEGRKALEVKEVGNIHTVDMGLLAKRMGSLLAKNIRDPEWHEWVVPEYSTTTVNDECTASIIMMGTLQKYFSYKFTLCCGLPSVTILGTKDDWMEILKRLERLPQLGAEPEKFSQLLRPVILSFVQTFDSPDSLAVKDFWLKIAHRSPGGSGPTYLSGWITAFCFWDANGKSMYSIHGKEPLGPVEQDGWNPHSAGCQLGQTLYHKVEDQDIPVGYASVPVTVDDNGTVYKTKMVAGSLGIRAWSTGGTLDENTWRHSNGDHQQVNLDTREVYNPGDSRENPTLDSVQAVSGWFMYELRHDASHEDPNDVTD